MIHPTVTFGVGCWQPVGCCGRSSIGGPSPDVDGLGCHGRGLGCRCRFWGCRGRGLGCSGRRWGFSFTAGAVCAGGIHLWARQGIYRWVAHAEALHRLRVVGPVSPALHSSSLAELRLRCLAWLGLC